MLCISLFYNNTKTKKLLCSEVGIQYSIWLRQLINMLMLLCIDIAFKRNFLWLLLPSDNFVFSHSQHIMCNKNECILPYTILSLFQMLESFYSKFSISKIYEMKWIHKNLTFILPFHLFFHHFLHIFIIFKWFDYYFVWSSRSVFWFYAQ